MSWRRRRSQPGRLERLGYRRPQRPCGRAMTVLRSTGLRRCSARKAACRKTPFLQAIRFPRGRAPGAMSRKTGSPGSPRLPPRCRRRRHLRLQHRRSRHHGSPTNRRRRLAASTSRSSAHPNHAKGGSDAKSRWKTAQLPPPYNRNPVSPPRRRRHVICRRRRQQAPRAAIPNRSQDTSGAIRKWKTEEASRPRHDRPPTSLRHRHRYARRHAPKRLRRSAISVRPAAPSSSVVPPKGHRQPRWWSSPSRLPSLAIRHRRCPRHRCLRCAKPLRARCRRHRGSKRSRRHASRCRTSHTIIGADATNAASRGIPRNEPGRALPDGRRRRPPLPPSDHFAAAVAGTTRLTQNGPRSASQRGAE